MSELGQLREALEDAGSEVVIFDHLTGFFFSWDGRFFKGGSDTPTVARGLWDMRFVDAEHALTVECYDGQGTRVFFEQVTVIEDVPRALYGAVMSAIGVVIDKHQEAYGVYQEMVAD